MKTSHFFIALLICLTSCIEDKKNSAFNPENWEKRKAEVNHQDSSLNMGRSYLSVYSEIYSGDEHTTRDLTVTLGMRNLSDKDTIYILDADYYHTHGNLVRSYFDHPIYLAPYETVEIVIDHIDEAGGTGANFIFNWASPSDTEPLFDAVMILAKGNQGLSFTTQGIRIY